MSIKLFNFSGLPDQPMKTLLERAANQIGCRISRGLVVKVTRGGYSSRSYAYRSNGVEYRFLANPAEFRKKGKLHPYQRPKIPTDCGWISISPRIAHHLTFLRSAQLFFETALHEFAHVRDYQIGEKDFCYYQNGHRLRWHKRPHEIRAERIKVEALEAIGNEADELILELAFQIEQKEMKTTNH